MKVGIGVITCGVRPLHSLLEPAGAITATFTDLGRRGPAYSRNEVLHQLYVEGCDHFFLFDDDCYPVMPGWAEYFIEQHKASGFDFLGLPEAFKSPFLGSWGEVGFWGLFGALGCFSSQTRRMVDRIGYYNEAYRTYGYEDSGRNLRAIRAMGLEDGQGRYPSPIRASAYIHSQDVFGERPTPNMTMAEKQVCVDANHPLWMRERDSAQLYYPYPRAPA